MLPVKSAVVGSTPGHAGGRGQRHPDTAQQTTPHKRGGLEVWRGWREVNKLVCDVVNLMQALPSHRLVMEHVGGF